MRVAPLTKGVTGVTSGTGIIMELSWMNENQVFFHTFWEIAWDGSKIYFVPVNQCRDLFDEGDNFGANPVEGGEFTGDHEWVITYIPSLGPISIHPERPLLDF